MPRETSLTLDLSAYLLGQNSKVASDAGFLFYGQSDVASGAATLEAARARFSFDLARLPADTERVALALTIEQGVRRGQQFSHLKQLVLTVERRFGADPSSPSTPNPMSGNGGHSRRVLQTQRYLEVSCDGTRFRGGLGPLASHFGVEISMIRTKHRWLRPPHHHPCSCRRSRLTRKPPSP